MSAQVCKSRLMRFEIFCVYLKSEDEQKKVNPRTLSMYALQSGFYIGALVLCAHKWEASLPLQASVHHHSCESNTMFISSAIDEILYVNSVDSFESLSFRLIRVSCFVTAVILLMLDSLERITG